MFEKSNKLSVRRGPHAVLTAEMGDRPRLKGNFVFNLTLIAAVLGIPFLCFAGVPEYPSSVQADRIGEFTVVIWVSDAPDHNFSVVEVENVTLLDQSVVSSGEGEWKITLRGRLINLREDGLIRFKVDPAGQIVDGEIIVLAPPGIPTVSEWGLIIMALLLVTVGIVVIVRRSKTRLA